MSFCSRDLNRRLSPKEKEGSVEKSVNGSSGEISRTINQNVLVSENNPWKGLDRCDLTKWTLTKIC